MKNRLLCLLVLALAIAASHAAFSDPPKHYVYTDGTNLYMQVGSITNLAPVQPGTATQYLYYAAATNCSGLWADANNVYFFKITNGVYCATTNAIP